MSKLAFLNGLLIDGTGRDPIEKSLVLVEDKKIVYAGKSKEVPKGYEVRELQEKQLCPV